MGGALQERRGTSTPQITAPETLQVRERIRGGRVPLFIIQRTERNLRIAQMWRLPGTSVRVSSEGDIYYPVWRERSHVLKPELYAPCSKLPRGWILGRLLASKRRPISEVGFHQVKKDGGAVEAGIRSMDHVLERYQNKGKELEQVRAVREQIAQATAALQKTQGVSREEFEEEFGGLYQQTLGLMETCGMKRARLALKRDIERLLEEAATGKDRTGRRNPVAMMKKLEAAA
ncbi:hypothetical protein HZB97_03690, partial [Candidatus Gottesmanbacteria bacterium]|nr:hypothetical protein [Candidatus Gottesmanbacteria bacterium]